MLTRRVTTRAAVPVMRNRKAVTFFRCLGRGPPRRSGQISSIPRQGRWAVSATTGDGSRALRMSRLQHWSREALGPNGHGAPHPHRSECAGPTARSTRQRSVVPQDIASARRRAEGDRGKNRDVWCNGNSDEGPVRMILGVERKSGYSKQNCACERGRKMGHLTVSTVFEMARRQPIAYGKELKSIPEL